MSTRSIVFARTPWQGDRNRVLQWSVEREWSCPYHDEDVNDRWDDDPELEQCLGCEAGGWKVVYDADGWATLTVSEMGSFQTMLWNNRAGMVEAYRGTQAHILLKELGRDPAEFEGREIVVPVITAPGQGRMVTE